MTQGTRGRLCALVAAGIVAFAFAAPVAVSANTGGGGGSSGAPVSVISATFANKLVVNVTLEVTCQPFAQLNFDGTPTGTTSTSGTIVGVVDLLQAQGRTIAHATGSINPPTQSGPLVTCDGSAFRVTVPVLAQDLPLRRGAAVVSVTIGMSPSVPCCDPWSSDFAGAGPVAVKIS